MEKQERTFSYQLATELSPHDLDKVSGGNNQMTTRATLAPTGQPSSTDVGADVKLDW